jgi:hypothetical protein
MVWHLDKPNKNWIEPEPVMTSLIRADYQVCPEITPLRDGHQVKLCIAYEVSSTLECPISSATETKGERGQGLMEKTPWIAWSKQWSVELPQNGKLYIVLTAGSDERLNTCYVF